MTFGFRDRVPEQYLGDHGNRDECSPDTVAEKLHPDLQPSGKNSNSKYCGVLKTANPTPSDIIPPIRPQL